MGKRNFNAYTNGTAALKMPRWAETAEDAKIIMFPTRNSAPAVHNVRAHAQEKPAAERKTATAKRILESSEMYCSLKLESMLGCPYNLFTKQGIAILSACSGAIAIVSLILGA
ncbi:MAG: hypothetical protein IJ111_03920 [Eggerthellaceae bacterium]|nr:hypothetical protein [Eggerthellaceae bacterium]